MSYLQGGEIQAPPVPNLWAMLPESGEGVTLRVGGYSGAVLPTHVEFQQQSGLSVTEIDRSVSANLVFALLLRRGIVFTDNVRQRPDYSYPPVTLAEAIEGLSTGTGLAAYLYRRKNGGPDDRARYRAIQEMFAELADRSFDVKPVPESLTEQQIIDGKKPGEVLEISIESDYGDVPLEQSGAGKDDALYVAAVVAGSEGQVVLLDEPGAYLHPNIRTAVVDQLIRKGKDTQFFVVTHSAELIPPEAVDKISRFYLPGGRTRRVSLDWSNMNEQDRAKLQREFRLSLSARALLFSRGVILVEGETELGALPEWYAKWSQKRLDRADIAVHCVGGEDGFGTYIWFLDRFHVPWVAFCDGLAIGPRFSKNDLDKPPDKTSKIARQLENAGAWRVPSDLQHQIEALDTFAKRRDALQEYGILTVALASNRKDEPFERLQVIQANWGDAEKIVGSSKARRGRYIAEKFDCPDELGQLFDSAMKHLSERMNGELPMTLGWKGWNRN